VKEEEVIKRAFEKLARVKDIAPPLEARALAVAAAEELGGDADSLGLRILREGKPLKTVHKSAHFLPFAPGSSKSAMVHGGRRKRRKG
jgi:hypothetical protein